MKHLTRMSIHSIDAASAQPLSRDRMRAIKGGGGNCYVYCQNGSTTTMVIAPDCSVGHAEGNNITKIVLAIKRSLNYSLSRGRICLIRPPQKDDFMHNIVLLLGLVFFCGGTVFAQPNPIEIKIDPKNMPEGDLRMSDLIESVEYIPLETTDKCLIGDGVRYDFNDEYIIAGDLHGEAVYLFNRKGKFIRAIGGKGPGPQEFTYIGKLWINNEDQNIMVSCGKILHFNYKGDYLYATSFPVDDRECDRYFHGNFLRVAESYLLRDSSYYVFNLFDTKGRFVKEAIRSVPIPLIADKQWRIALRVIPIERSYEYDNAIHVRETMNDTIYRIDGLNNFIPKYVFNLGKYRLTPEIQGNLPRFRELASNCVVPQYIAETTNHILIRYKYQDTNCYCYFDKAEGKTYAFNSKNGFPNDYDGGLDFFFMLNDCQKNQYLSRYIHADEFTDPEKRTKLEPHGPQSAVQAFEKLVKKVDPDDNPIIMIVKLKE